MPGLLGKIAKFARSPQGQQAIRKAQAAAQKPENRAKIQQMAQKLQRRGGQPPR